MPWMLTHLLTIPSDIGINVTLSVSRLYFHRVLLHSSLNVTTLFLARDFTPTSSSPAHSREVAENSRKNPVEKSDTVQQKWRE